MNNQHCFNCGMGLSEEASLCPSCGEAKSHDKPIDTSIESEGVKILRRVGILSYAQVITIVIGLIVTPISLLVGLFSMVSRGEWKIGIGLVIGIPVVYGGLFYYNDDRCVAIQYCPTLGMEG